MIDNALGTWVGHKPKFACHLVELKALCNGGVHKYAETVQSGSFLDAQAESYAMEEEEWSQFKDGGHPGTMRWQCV